METLVNAIQDDPDINFDVLINQQLEEFYLL